MTEDHTSVVTSVTPRVSVIVPARNEQDTLERCLRSLVEQEGVPFELLVVDDASTDRTREIITFFAGVKECPFIGTNPSLAGVRAFESRTPVPEGWTGKANAIWTAVNHARGEWLLFTDADTFHAKGSLARAVAEAEQYGADLLSYSPRQELGSLPERMLMPVVFSELATQYKPREVCDPTSPVAAANGQYLLIRRDVYNKVGGHAAVAGDLLEDVALAVRVKEAGGKLRFRVGNGEVSARMYRTLDQLVEGWTKNLTLLFPKAKVLAYQRATEFGVMWGLLLLAEEMALLRHPALALWAAALAVFVWINFIRRISKAHSGWFNNILAIFGLPMFSWLLLRSITAHRHHSIWWKGREYSGLESLEGEATSENVIETGPSGSSNPHSS
ncbi:MAG TPA: glycosyltransferase family 2 protein [Terriglobales bacterium]|nr:glycosyltransferase family 2 protein [Terriglobales bacterium]